MTTKKKIPEFIQPQIPVGVEKPPAGKTWLHEIKFDGMRLQIHVEGKYVRAFDMKGIERSKEFPTLIENILEIKVKNAIYDTEAVILDRQGKSQYSHLEKALRFKDDTQIKVFFFDLLYLNNADLRLLPLIERKDILKELIPDIHPRLRFSGHVTKDPENFFNINCQQQLEGIVSKMSSAPYMSGKNKNWCQTKCTKKEEFIIAGYSSETNELILGKFEREKFYFVGRVLADDKFIRIKKQLAKIPLDSSVLEKVPERTLKTKGIHWVKPEIKAEVNFSNWTDEKLLRNPVLVEVVN